MEYVNVIIMTDQYNTNWWSSNLAEAKILYLLYEENKILT